MNKTRLEPLGVPNSGYEAEARAEHAAPAEPSAVDRWLIKQVTSRLGDAPIDVVLWDVPLEQVPEQEGRVAVRIADRKALMQLLANPELHFGDLYSAGRLEVRGDLLTLLDAAYRSLDSGGRLAAFIRRGSRIAPDLSESRRNIHHHYDIGNEFYRLWLDREALQYTCAYYADPSMTIEEAQQAKMHHVCRKLQLASGERVVEAGGGWGGFALFMAKHYGVNVRSFNISKEQIAHAREWAKREGLERQVEFVEDDYRNAAGTASPRYDAFVSIGMLEHVGPGNYPALGNLIDRLLTPEGRGLIHSIGRDRPERLNPWIDKRIFPGAYPPTLRQMMDIFEPNRLSVLDIENIRLHYAETLRAWLARYEENVDQVRALFDETFVRAWRLYLAGSIMAFVHGKLQLFQVLFARSGFNNVPWTRAHVYERS